MRDGERHFEGAKRQRDAGATRTERTRNVNFHALNGLQPSCVTGGNSNNLCLGTLGLCGFFRLGYSFEPYNQISRRFFNIFSLATCTCVSEKKLQAKVQLSIS